MSNENLNTTADVTNPTARLWSRRNSILKAGDADKKNETVLLDEPTSKTKKLRRVSFSAKVHVKEIDETLGALLSKNDTITHANTKANSKALGDISNANNNFMDVDSTTPNKTVYDESMEIDDYESILEVDQTNAIFKASFIQNDLSTLKSSNDEEIEPTSSKSMLNVTYDQFEPPNKSHGQKITDDDNGISTSAYAVSKLDDSEMASQVNETTTHKTRNETITQSNLPALSMHSLAEPSFLNENSIAGENLTLSSTKTRTRSGKKGTTIPSNAMSTSGQAVSMLDDSKFGMQPTQRIANATLTSNNLPGLSMHSIQEPSILNETSMMTSTLPVTTDVKSAKTRRPKSKDKDFANLSTSIHTEYKFEKGSPQTDFITLSSAPAASSKVLSHLPVTLSTASCNKVTEIAAIPRVEPIHKKSLISEYQNEFQIAAIPKVEPMHKKSLVSEYQDLLARVNARLQALKNQRAQQMAKSDTLESENSQLLAKLALVKARKEEKKAECGQKRTEIERTKLDAISKGQISFYTVKDQDIENLEKKLEKTNEKDLEREYNNKLESCQQLKESVENKTEKIKEIEASRNQSSQLLNLYRNIFSETNLQFKILHMDNDTLVLAFFFDLIQLEIKSINLFQDLSLEKTLKPVQSLEEFMRRETYYRYPLQAVVCRSVLDENGNEMTGHFGGRASRMSIGGQDRSIKIPPFLRYCLNLVMGEIGEGDLIAPHKISCVKDLPLLITKFRLACECATNLANDFDYVINAFKKGKRKVEFDWANKTVSLLLHSPEDFCFYRLNLNILPGLYYQDPIAFTIDQDEDEELMQPNTKKITKALENSFFVKGSLRTYLKQIKVL